jgi:hypothetical protein
LDNINVLQPFDLTCLIVYPAYGNSKRKINKFNN